MLEELLRALGVATVAEAQAAISRFNQMVDEILVMTGAQTSGEALEQVRRLHKFAGSIETAAGAKGPEVLARMEGWRTSAELLATTQTELTQMRATQERAQANALMDTATREQRLAPAMRAKAESFFADYGMKALETFLQTLPPAGISDPSRIRQPTAPKQEGTEAEWTSDDAAYAKATGRSKDQVMASRRLWDETNGVIPTAHVEALNKKSISQRA